MKYQLLSGLIVLIFFWGCNNSTNRTIVDLNAPDLTICKASRTLFASFVEGEEVKINKLNYPRLVYADEPSDFPKIQANRNLQSAGVLKDDILRIELEVSWGDFYMEDENRPGLHMVAIGEKGKLPSIPAPLIRVEEGTTIQATIYNSLPDSTISVFGLQSRPSEDVDSLFILPGESKTVEFSAGASGTYLYNVQLGNYKSNFDLGEEDQLNGAFVIDPKGAKVKDRILVINIFSFKVPEIDSVVWLESLTINGKSWPYTELMELEVGETVRWKVINASVRNHPMHLHGFYYDVLSSGKMLQDDIYQPEDRRKVVTEFMTGRTTMDIQWIPEREGRWLFHCHLSFHVSGEIRLPDGTDGEHGDHMAGLVTGVDVKPGSRDLFWKGEEREIALFANEYENERNGFTTESDYSGIAEVSKQRPLLLLHQYQPTYITVINRMAESTSIHWHGLEIDSWSDGVPEWSSSDGKTSPTIKPGSKFRYKLALMRPGSFIYHSHLDDINQLTSGLYGPLIVLGENKEFDPKTDHPYIVSWKNPDPKSLSELEINGSDILPEIHTIAGVKHRLRLMHIAPAGRIAIHVERDGGTVPLRIIAKDGADLPENQRVMVESSFKYGVGETADFEFVPEKPGIYKLHFWNNITEKFWVQDWVVRESK